MSQKNNQKTTKAIPQKPKAKPITATEFNIKHASFDEFIDNKHVKKQFVSFPKYNKGEFVFVTDWFYMETYGIPNNPEYIKEDFQKQKIRVPLNPNGQTPNLAFIKMLKEIDTLALENLVTQAPAKLKAAFKKATKDFSGLFKSPEEELQVDIEDDPEAQETDPKKKTEEPETKPKKLDYFNVKFDTDFETGNITTVIYVTRPNPDDPTKDLPPVRENLTNINDIEKLITWRSKIRMVVKLAKLWSNKAPEKGILKCGLTLKVKQIEIKPSEKGNMADKDAFRDYAFGNNANCEEESNAKDGEETNDADNNANNEENKSDKDNSENNSGGEENSIPSEADESSEEVVVEAPKKSPLKKKVGKN